MKISSPIVIKVAALATFAVLGFLVATPSRAGAAYTGNNIIDNAVFLDSRSMTAAEIQAFLVSKNSGIANSSFLLNCYAADSKERQWYTAVGAPCDQNVPASSIIYYAAQIYGINPKVVLATLQKEQSLVTTPNPTDWQINQAMGYGCPTTGGCGASTFFYQIDNGTWVLRYHYERAQGNMAWWTTSTSWTCGTEKNFYKPNLYPSQNVSFYDEDGVLYRTYYIENAATSSLYCYTPHAYNNPLGLYGRAPYGTVGRYYSGSYNFVNFFELWFGSTRGSYLLRTANNATVFLTVENMKYPIGDVNTYNSLAPLGAVKYVSQDYLDGFSMGPQMGRIFKDDVGTVFFYDSGFKLPFSTCDLVSDYGYSCNYVVKLSKFQVDSFTTGPNMTNFYKTTTNKSFYIKSGQKREVFDDASLSQVGLSPAYNRISESGVAHLASGLPVVRDGVVMMDRANSSKYLNDDGTLIKIREVAYEQSWLRNIPSRYFDSASLNMMPKANAETGLFFKDLNTGFSYCVTGAGKARVADPSSLANSYTNISGALLSTMPNDQGLDPPYFLKPAQKATVYFVQASKKRPIGSWSQLVRMGGSNSIRILPDSAVDEIESGVVVLAQGTLVKGPSDATVYYVDSIEGLVPVSSFGITNDLGVPGAVITVETSVISSYTNLTGALSPIIECEGHRYVGVYGVLNKLSPDQEATMGLDHQTIQTCPSQGARDLVGNFFLDSRGTIYEISGGKKNPIASYVKYLSLGGDQNNTVRVSDSILSAIPLGIVLF